MEASTTSSQQGDSWRSNPLFVFVTVVIGITTETFVYGVVIPLLPFILKRFPSVINDPSSLQLTVSVLLASEAFVGVALSPILGLALDRYSPRKWPFVFGLLLLIVSVPVFFTTDSLLILFLARCGQGASGAIIWTVGFDLCFRVAGIQNLGLSFSTVVSSAYAGAMGAPALGGFIYEHFGPMAVVGLLEVILLLDLVMRLLIKEPENTSVSSTSATVQPNTDQATSQEATPLIGSRTDMEDPCEANQIHAIFRWIPILNCFEEPPFVASIILTIINSSLVGAFNATIPLHGKDVFGFDSTGAGLLLLPIAVSRVVASPIGGRLVDKIGTRKVATLGYVLMTIGLALFPTVSFLSRSLEIAAFGALLTLCGIGLAIVGPGTWVEGMTTVRRYHLANPHLFWKAGPYASLQALNMMTFQIGLAVGPLIAGELRDRIGFGNMSVVLSIFVSTSAAIAWMRFSAGEEGRAS